MQITIAAVGTRLEPWLYQAFESYQSRLPQQLTLSLAEVPLARRSGAAPERMAVESEGERLLKHAGPNTLALVLDERGRQWSSAELADQLKGWMARQPRVSILIGGPDGLSEACRARADRVWSLSRLTFPHGIVRVLVAEQIYRAWTILQGHPYHRA